jgi:hypothetical protein
MCRLLAHLYGPAVRCKPDVTDLEITGLAHLYSALFWSGFAPGHHGYPHTSDLIRVKALEGRMCHQITDATVGPFLHLLNPTRRPRRVSQRPGCLT